MAKTPEELNQLKTEYQTLTTKLQELTEEELNMVIGGHESTANLYFISEELGIGLENDQQYEYHMYKGDINKNFQDKLE